MDNNKLLDAEIFRAVSVLEGEKYKNSPQVSFNMVMSRVDKEKLEERTCAVASDEKSKIFDYLNIYVRLIPSQVSFISITSLFSVLLFTAGFIIIPFILSNQSQHALGIYSPAINLKTVIVASITFTAICSAWDDLKEELFQTFIIKPTSIIAARSFLLLSFALGVTAVMTMLAQTCFGVGLPHFSEYLLSIGCGLLGFSAVLWSSFAWGSFVSWSIGIVSCFISNLFMENFDYYMLNLFIFLLSPAILFFSFRMCERVKNHTRIIEIV